MNNNLQFGSYKNYIQSLRAFSVLIVFLYHLNLDIFSKGYLGVDIFFVISGFVISQRIYKDYLIKNKILIKNFFIRRFKRIFPVLLFVIIVCFLTFTILGPINHLRTNLETSLFSIVGISNIYFLKKETNYFDTVFDDPLGHTWSLGVEEQFYIIYPFMIYFLFKFTKINREKKIVFILFLISIFLVLITFYFSKYSPELVFYFPLFRFWEFLAGCIIFFISTKLQNKKKNIFSILFLILILFILFLDLPKNYTFYISINLLVVLFAALLILFYSENSINKIIFENKFLIFIGNISYSLYLWHLPVIYFIELYFGNFAKNIFSFPISFALSVFTFYFIENKFRYYNFRLEKKYFYRLSIFLFLSFTFIITFHVFQKNFTNSIKASITNTIYKINYLENNLNFYKRTNFLNVSINENKIYKYCTEDSLNYILNNLNLREECLKIKDNNLIFFVEGNSHTANFVNMFDKSNFVNNFYYLHKSIQVETYHNRSFALANSLTNNFKNVVYTTNIDTIFQLNSLKNNIHKFNENISILILGPIPNITDSSNLPVKCMIRKINCFIDTDLDKKKRNLIELNQLINDFAKKKNIFFFDAYQILCPLKNCVTYNKEKNILKLLDHSHLSLEGAVLLLPEFKNFYNDMVLKLN